MIRADNVPLGTQLKLMLTLEHGTKAMFKPQWYSRDAIIQGPVYHGKDRHNAEVVAFHLSSLLALRRVPLTVIRKCIYFLINIIITYNKNSYILSN